MHCDILGTRELLTISILCTDISLEEISYIQTSRILAIVFLKSPNKTQGLFDDNYSLWRGGFMSVLEVYLITLLLRLLD